MGAPVVETDDAQKGKARRVKRGPFSTRMQDDGSKKMSFILPAEYNSMKKIPKPTNPRVQVIAVPSAAGAVTTFTGWATGSRVEAKKAQLLDRLKALGVDA